MNNNLPILGCPTCNTTAGRSVCRFHRDIVVNYSPSSSWNLPHDGKSTTMQDSFEYMIEYMTKNLVEEYVNQNGKKYRVKILEELDNHATTKEDWR